MEDRNFNIPAVRKKWILDYILKYQGAQIAELAEVCSVSEATIRRDLRDLDEEGHVERTHGGAIPVRSTSFEVVHEEKMKLMLEEKQRIAKKAAEMIGNGESIFLDSGSTNFFIAQNLTKHQNLTVITHNTNIAHISSLHPTTTLVITGGIKREHYSVLVGSMAESLIRDLHVDKAFLGADAVDVQKGVFNSNIVELGIKRLIIGCGERAILVTDSSKFQTPALVRICGFEALHTIITDNGLSKEDQQKIEKTGCNLIIV